MEFLLFQLLNGLVYGTLLFLTAAGLSLIFGMMNVVSLVHGSFFMLGAYFGLALYQLTGNFWLAFVIAPLPAALIGVAMEMGFMRPLYRRGHMDQVLLTFGFTYIFSDAVQTIWGKDIQSLAAPPSLAGVVDLGFNIYPTYRLFLIGLGLGLAALLWLFLDRSRLGAKIRAGVDDSAMASGLGGNIPALFTGIFAAGVALAALGGVAGSPVLGIYPGEDTDILIPAFIVIVVGGMGSLRGAFIGSLLIGVADTLGQVYLPNLAQFLIYLVMAAVLLVRPQGLFGVRQGSASSSVAMAPAGLPRQSIVLTLMLVIALIAYPFLVSAYPRALVTEIFIFAIFAMSLDLLLGFTGLMSFGHAAFFGLAGYFVIVLGAHFGVNEWVGVAFGVLAAAVAATIIGFFCVRTRGITFLMLTLAFSQLVFSIALKWRHVTGGSDGIGIPTKPSFFGWSLLDSHTMYIVTFAFFVLCYSALRRLVSSPLGQVFIGIRENEERMRSLGYATRTYKIAAFAIGGALAGFAGGLYAIFNGFISPDALYWSASGDVLIMVMLGGAGTLIGPVLGVAAFLLMKNLISSYSAHWQMIIGATFVASVLFFPGGIWSMLRRLRIGVQS